MPARGSRKVQTSTRRALTEAQRLDTPLGQSALALAAMVDDSSTPATARVAAAKELRSTLAEACQSATVKADPVDELKRRREVRLASGG